MRAQRLRGHHAATLLVVSLGACNDGRGELAVLPYDPYTTVVIGGDVDGGIRVYDTPSGAACVELDGNDCLQPHKECGEGAYADVLLDPSGAVTEVVCLPVQDTTAIVDVKNGVARVPDNGAVVRLDGPARRADVTVEGNSAVLYGDGPKDAVIDGDLTLRGNTSVVRGLTITGDVTFDGNTAALYYCVVHGDVILKGNENLVSNCTVHGSIRGSGNDDRLISNYVSGTITLSGEADECRDNRSFVDADDDHVLDAAERDISRPLECVKK